LKQWPSMQVHMHTQHAARDLHLLGLGCGHGACRKTSALSQVANVYALLLLICLAVFVALFVGCSALTSSMARRCTCCPLMTPSRASRATCLTCSSSHTSWRHTGPCARCVAVVAAATTVPAAAATAVWCVPQAVLPSGIQSRAQGEAFCRISCGSSNSSSKGTHRPTAGPVAAWVGLQQ
jgi:hypothetical protein